MLQKSLLILLCALLLLLGSGRAAPARGQDGVPTAGALFVANAGQWAASARFGMLGGPGQVWLTNDAIWITLAETGNGVSSAPPRTLALRLRVEGVGAGTRLEGLAPQPTSVSFYEGRDPARWQERVPTWGSARWVGLAEGRSLEVRAGAAGLSLLGMAGGGNYVPQTMRLRLEGASLMGVEAGSLQVATPWGAARLPLAVSGGSVEVVDPNGAAARVPLLAEAEAARGINGNGALRYSSFLGTELSEEAATVQGDAAGNLYVGGNTLAPIFPTEPGLRAGPHAVEAYLAKMRPGSTVLDYVIFITSDVEDFTTALTVDGAGQVYAAGFTDSSNFPTTEGAFDGSANGGFDAFVMKVRADGTLAYSTLLGGDSAETVSDIAVDSAGNAYVTGGVWSLDFPLTPGAYDASHNGLRDVFVTKVNADGTGLLHSTFLGGSGQDQAEGLALRAPDEVVLTGWTRSTDFPTTAGTLDPTANGDFDAFALGLSLRDAQLQFSTFLGGSGEDRGYGIAADGMGGATVVGRTGSANFPTTPGAFDPTYATGTCDFTPCPDAFALRLAADGRTLAYSTFLGGPGADEAAAVALGADGTVFLTGETHSADFPTTPDGYSTTRGGTVDAFLTALSADGATLRYGSFLGGSRVDGGADIGLPGPGLLLVAGRTESPDFPVTGDAFDPLPNGDYDGFVTVLELPAAPLPTATATPPASATPPPTATPAAPGALYLPLVVR